MCSHDILRKGSWSPTSFEDKLARALTHRKKNVLPREGQVTAAVLIALFWKNEQYHVLLTQRSQHVEHHKGEISFPGGKLDDTDPDLLSCALRETEEEVGIAREHVRILGELDDFYTVATNFLVVPFVGVIPHPYEFNPSSREIFQLLSVPLDVFFDHSLRRIEQWSYGGKSVEVVFYDWNGYTIWGATGRILKHFTELVEEVECRRSHHASR